MSTQEAFQPEAADDWLPLLDHELNRLAEKYRLPIVLCDLEGKTRKEAARHLDWPEGTIATRLTRGRALLAGRLARRGVTLSAGVLALGLSRQAFSAGMPASLVSATVRAATDYAAGPAAAVAVSARVAALTEGVLKTMLLTRLKTITAVALVLGLLGTGLGTGLVPMLAAPPGQDVPPERTAVAPPGGRPIVNVPPHALPSGPPPQQAMVSLDEDDALIVQMRATYIEPVTTLTPDGQRVTSYRQRDALQTHQSPRGEYQAYDTKLKKIALKELRKRLRDETPALVFTGNKRIDPLHLRFTKEGTLVFNLPGQVAMPAAPVALPAPAAGPLQPVPVSPVNVTPPATSVPVGAPFISTAVPPPAAAVPIQPAPTGLTPPAVVEPPALSQAAPPRNTTQPPPRQSPLQILLEQGGTDRVLFHIQGEWAVVAHTRDGKRVPDEEFRDYHVVIRDGKMWLSRGNSVLGGKKLRVEIDATKKPATIDTYLDGPKPRLISHGILEVKEQKGMKLLMIYETPADQPRPTAFERGGSHTPSFATIYRRVTDAKQP